jgi:hypothetical protein
MRVHVFLQLHVTSVAVTQTKQPNKEIANINSIEWQEDNEVEYMRIEVAVT